jgi:ADP-glucose pyrophosphorylase
VLPAALKGPWCIGAYAPAGFFDDVGSVAAYYDAHMALARGVRVVIGWLG